VRINGGLQGLCGCARAAVVARRVSVPVLALSKLAQAAPQTPRDALRSIGVVRATPLGRLKEWRAVATRYERTACSSTPEQCPMRAALGPSLLPSLALSCSDAHSYPRRAFRSRSQIPMGGEPAEMLL
jgi:hypothetical protein